MSYRGKAALTVATMKNGAHTYIYAGGLVPDSVGDEELKRLEREGFIESSEPAKAAKAPESSDPNKAPAKSASKDEWVAFAKSKGDEDAEGKTKEQLIADHGES